MKHPFQVGETYENRDGKYQVVMLEEPRMIIQYLDGQSLETSVRLQARIWRNIQAEERLESQPDREGHIKPNGPKSSKDRRGHSFQGLSANDFQNGVAGTSWRARANLGGLLARQLSDATPYFFQSYVIYRRAEVHIARPECYEKTIRRQEAKFVFSLSEECAGYGFYIEKNKGPMDNTWHWLNFLGAIEKDVALQQKIKAAMIQMQLRWEVYVWEKGGLIAQVRPLSDSDSLQWDEENQGESTNISWPDFVDRLKAIETEDGCDLHLCTHMNKEQAMAAGIGLANSVTQVYQALLPVYEASTRRVGSEQT